MRVRGTFGQQVASVDPLAIFDLQLRRIGNLILPFVAVFVDYRDSVLIDLDRAGHSGYDLAFGRSRENGIDVHLVAVVD